MYVSTETLRTAAYALSSMIVFLFRSGPRRGLPWPQTQQSVVCGEKSRKNKVHVHLLFITADISKICLPSVSVSLLLGVSCGSALRCCSSLLCVRPTQQQQEEVGWREMGGAMMVVGGAVDQTVVSGAHTHYAINSDKEILKTRGIFNLQSQQCFVRLLTWLFNGA